MPSSPAATSTSGAPPRTRPRGLEVVAGVVVLGSIMTVLDTTVVNVALGQLARSLEAPLDVIQWVVSGYTLALATVIPATAWSAARFGPRRTYLVAIVLFTVSSLLAGLAWDAPSLIAFRVLQGLGGGMVAPVGMMIVVHAAPEKHLGRAMALLGLPVLIGPLIGPVLGGWLVDAVSWRWMFFVNVPLGALVVLLGVRLLPRGPARDTAPPRLDVLGLLTLSPGLALVILGLSSARDGSATSAVLVGLGLVLVAGFVWRALTAEHPLIDLRLLRRRTYAAGLGVMALYPGAYFGTLLLVPLYLQTSRGLSAAQAGMLVIPQVLATGLTMQVATRLVDRVPAGRVVLGGIATTVVGLVAFTLLLDEAAPLWTLVCALVVLGAGAGMTLLPTMTAVQRGLPPEQVPTGATSLNILSQLSNSAGTAALSLLLAQALSARLPAGRDGLESLIGLPPAELATVRPLVAGAFAAALAWPVVLLVVAAVPALFLPRRNVRADDGEPRPRLRRRRAGAPASRPA